MSKNLLEKQIEKIRETYPESEFLERLFAQINDSYEDFEKVQKLKDRSIRMMSQEMLDLYKTAQKKNEAFIATILGTIVDGIITCDTYGRIVAVNSSAEQILGRKEKNLLENDLSNVLADFDSFNEFIEQYDKVEDQNEIEVFLSGKKQPRIPCEISVSKFEIDEVSYIVIFRDITERKKQEAAIIEEKEKAEKASQAKAEFLSTMSHEIRTPMNSIVGITNILIGDETDPEKLKLLDTLKFSSEHLLVLINDILDFSKIEAGKVEFENIDFNLRRTVRNIVEACKFKGDEKNIEVKFDWDEKLSNHVKGDPSRLAQILTNLIGNAVKFTEKGSVTTKVTLLEEKEVSNVIRFEVIDTGIGIQKEKQSMIFESFSQTDSYTTRKYGGTGLGLAITKRLIELQHSKVQLESEYGKGSNFFFDLEMDKSLEKTNEQEERGVDPSLLDEKQLAGLSILLVEDNPLNQFVANKFLDKWKCDVEVAENGFQAIEHIEKKEFDIVLMDLQMPEKNGFEATAEIRSSGQAYKDIPIIALTASAFMEEKNRALEAGMNDFISKPFNPKELHEKISKNIRVN